MIDLDSGLRKALVIGNAAYGGALALRNPLRDADLFAESLRRLGFSVDLERNLEVRAFVAAVARFLDDLKNAEVGVFYYAGHGAQVNGHNFLIPIGCEPSTYLELESGAIKLQTLLDAISVVSPTSVFFLDCCRNNPLPRRLSDMGLDRALPAKGLASPTVPNGSYIAFSTLNDAVAEDGEGPNSLFTASLSRFIHLEDRSISDVMASVRREVRAGTQGRQIPMDWSTLMEPFVFNSAGRREPSPLQTAEEQQEEFWGYVKYSNNIEQIESFILRFPTGKYRQSAIEKRNSLYRTLLYGRALKGFSLAVSLIILFSVGYISVNSVRFRTLENVDLVGGDIDLVSEPVFKGAYFGRSGCKLSCILTFRCVAYTYSTADGGSCHLKNDYWIQISGEDVKGRTSEYIPRPAFADYKERPLSPNSYTINYTRVYAGVMLDGNGQDLPPKDPSDPKETETWLFGPKVRELRDQAGEFARLYRNDGTFCQALCCRLQQCQAFSYTVAFNRCKLLGHDATEMRLVFDGAKRVQAVFPSVISGVKRHAATADAASAN